MSAREPFLSVTVGAAPEAVWRALRDPAEIVRWFGWEYPGLEDEIALIFLGQLPDGVDVPEGFDSAVEVDEEARTLRTGPHEIAVVPAGDQAAVRVTRVIDVGDDGWEMFHSEIDQIEEGWFTFFQTLAFAAARHPGEPRRTVFGAGLIAGDPMEVLGLAPVLDLAPGARYEVAAGPGEVLTGTVRFRSQHQIGLTVDAWGDGLLVAAAVPGGTDDARPAMVIASTYGLPDATHTDLESRWTTWWETHSVPPEPPE